MEDASPPSSDLKNTLALSHLSLEASISQIGLRENLQETPIFNGKTMFSGKNFPLNQSNEFHAFTSGWIPTSTNLLETMGNYDSQKGKTGGNRGFAENFVQ